MSGKYSKRVRNSSIYDPFQLKSFKISRSRLDRFIECPRCFYIDRRLGMDRPDGYSFSLNLAVDELLKKEFDSYRDQQKVHPLCKEQNLNLIPFQHHNLIDWRNNKKGIEYEMPKTNFKVFGSIDDVWIDPVNNELCLVDYKATSTTDIISLDSDWRKGYKRQAEIYQWLFRKNGFKVSDTFYFVYCNGIKTLDSFDKTLKFDITILPYKADDSWVEATILEAYDCLQSSIIPAYTKDCGYCSYIQDMKKL